MKQKNARTPRTPTANPTMAGVAPGICDNWGVPDLGEQFRSPIQSNVPVLLISGSIDGRTPRSNVEEIALGFSDHRHLTVELGGHNDLATDLRIADAVRRWVSVDGSVPDVVQLAPLTFRIFQ